MKKYWVYLKNKYILTICIFLIYTLFLDDTDIFTIFSYNRKLSKLEQAKMETSMKLDSTVQLSNLLKYEDQLESYAREKKLFKQENEDIFVISYE